ncbi:hypothetical protein D6D00_06075 [Aureobasidium pullulans]|nr:hypothetical protein D6D00_06075 [Aureobasidium pullulans]
MCDFLGRLFRSSDPASDIIATKDETEIASLPPPYEELPPLRPSPEIPTSAVHALKRCLIWRMAINLGLKRYVPQIERPNDYEYSRFETCCEGYCKILGEHPFSQESLDDSNEMMFVFRPGSELGIPCDLLEFFMYSVRRATKHPTYVAKNKRITCHRDEVLLLRLVIDSRIIVDLVTNPRGAFAWRLKTKCARLHRKNFSWLLDPALINLDKRPPRSTSQHPMRRNSERTLETGFVVDGGMRATMRCVDGSLLVGHDQSHGALLLDGRKPPPTARFHQEEHQSSRKPFASCGDLRELGMVESRSDPRLLQQTHRGTMTQEIPG